MEPKVRVHALLYGDHPELHERLLDGFRRAVPERVPVRLWCNQPGASSLRLLEARRRPGWTVTLREDNVPKYAAMRAMFGELAGEDWVVWFDDDSWIEAADWYPVMLDAIRPPEVCYVGQRWGAHHLEGQWDFVRAAPWFRGLEPPLHEGKPAVWFAQGAYWWLRSDLRRAIDWPDPRLRHNGGDTLLGEAVRQQGRALTPCAYGVRVNDAPRRGLSERPAGALAEVRR